MRVIASDGRGVSITRERCDAVKLDGTLCREYDLRGPDGSVLCWVHRQAAELRGRLELERVPL